ncbi:MAG TPA: hypothetical protein PLA02_09785, partial [Brevefilum fermentans]|nr:hypothetical protein [Brevefilum fermentans]
GSIPLQGTGSAARRSAPTLGWADTARYPCRAQGVLREGLPLNRVGQTRRSAPTLGWADTEIRPNIGLGRHGDLPLHWAVQTQRSAPTSG